MFIFYIEEKEVTQSPIDLILIQKGRREFFFNFQGSYTVDLASTSDGDVLIGEPLTIRQSA